MSGAQGWFMPRDREPVPPTARVSFRGYQHSTAWCHSYGYACASRSAISNHRNWDHRHRSDVVPEEDEVETPDVIVASIHNYCGDEPTMSREGEKRKKAIQVAFLRGWQQGKSVITALEKVVRRRMHVEVHVSRH
jgi:hypothetical protein